MGLKYMLLLLGMCVWFVTPSVVQADYTYTSPATSTQAPAKPEILAGEAATVYKYPFTLIFEDDASPWDAYVSYGHVERDQPVRLCRYWQVSDVYELKLRSHFNNALIQQQNNTLMSFAYSDDLLKVFPFVYFPEDSLKLVETDDNGLSWSMLKSSTVDTENNTISAITDLNKGYIVVAGFVNPKILCNYDNGVKGITTISTKNSSSFILKIQNTYQLLIDMLQYRSEQAML